VENLGRAGTGGAGVYDLIEGERRDGVWERGGIGAGVCDREGIGAGVWDRGGTGAGVWDLEESCDGAGVWDLVGEMGVAGVDGREDMEADLECMELNRDRGDCAEELLYGVGEGEGDIGAGIGDNARCGSGVVTPRVVANAFN